MLKTMLVTLALAATTAATSLAATIKDPGNQQTNYPVLKSSIEGALKLLSTDSSKQFFQDNFAYDSAANDGPTIMVSDGLGTVGGGGSGEVFGREGSNMIKVSKDLVNQASDPSNSQYLLAQELLELTIAHEFAHWVDEKTGNSGRMAAKKRVMPGRRLWWVLAISAFFTPIPLCVSMRPTAWGIPKCR